MRKNQTKPREAGQRGLCIFLALVITSLNVSFLVWESYLSKHEQDFRRPSQTSNDHIVGFSNNHVSVSSHPPRLSNPQTDHLLDLSDQNGPVEPIQSNLNSSPKAAERLALPPPPPPPLQTYLGQKDITPSQNSDPPNHPASRNPATLRAAGKRVIKPPPPPPPLPPAQKSDQGPSIVVATKDREGLIGPLPGGTISSPLVKFNSKTMMVAFMHIGKNGGTAFRPLLQNSLKKKYGALSCDCGSHFDWSRILKDQKGKKQVAPVVMLRDPVKRAVSHFYFAKTLSWTRGMKIRTQSLSEYLKDPVSMLETRGVWQDGQAAVSWFSATHIAQWVGIVSRLVPERERQSLDAASTMHLAITRLGETWFFGFLGRLDESLAMLATRFDMPKAKMSKSNAHSHSKATPEEVKILRSLMPMDLFFFDYAQKYFERRLKGDHKLPPYELPGKFPTDFAPQSCVSTRFILSCPFRTDQFRYFHWELNKRGSREWKEQEKILPPPPDL